VIVPNRTPKPKLSVAQCRAIDDICTRRFGIPSMVLMENAARSALLHAQAMLRAHRARRVLVVAGPGNNGGDGLALARLLDADGIPASVFLPLDSRACSADCAAQRDILRSMRTPVHDGAPGLRRFAALARKECLVVDALFGTGLSRPPTGLAYQAILAMLSARADGLPVLSLDCPSGLDADTGHPKGGLAVVATRTVTFAAHKSGLLTPQARCFTGPVYLGTIGAPAAALRLARRLRK
jgi:NAD(P)H-hydrate epimerase